ncbi:cell wall hydrolase [Billgrantia sp. LNSP4103-1]|uniref:cell wall hydrolase n=1 Tax=Billgrantia sp. LNSP4103-1 TaxID=3410266 RepID=UPI00403EF941
MCTARIAGCLALLLGSLPILADQDRSEAIDQAEALEQAARRGEAPPSPLTHEQAEAIDPSGQAALDNPLGCLSRTLYWEAKGKTEAEKEAVANVVLNRLEHEAHPDTICEVVTEGSEQGACQFSWWCDGRTDEVTEEDAFDTARKVARRALNQELDDRTQGARFFHDRSVMPGWSQEFRQTGETEHFLLYRPEES